MGGSVVLAEGSVGDHWMERPAREIDAPGCLTRVKGQSFFSRQGNQAEKSLRRHSREAEWRHELGHPVMSSGYPRGDARVRTAAPRDTESRSLGRGSLPAALASRFARGYARSSYDGLEFPCLRRWYARFARGDSRRRRSAPRLVRVSRALRHARRLLACGAGCSLRSGNARSRRSLARSPSCTPIHLVHPLGSTNTTTTPPSFPAST